MKARYPRWRTWAVTDTGVEPVLRLESVGNADTGREAELEDVDRVTAVPCAVPVGPRASGPGRPTSTGTVTPAGPRRPGWRPSSRTWAVADTGLEPVLSLESLGNADTGLHCWQAELEDVAVADTGLEAELDSEDVVSRGARPLHCMKLLP